MQDEPFNFQLVDLNALATLDEEKRGRHVNSSDLVRAIELVGTSGNDGMVHKLKRYLEHDLPIVRMAAATSLGKISGEDAGRVLLNALFKENSNKVRTRIITALGENGYLPAILSISWMLNQPDAQIKIAASEAVKGIAEKNRDRTELLGLYEAMTGALDDPNIKVRTTIIMTFGIIGGSAIDHLINALEDRKGIDARTCWEIRKVLARAKLNERQLESIREVLAGTSNIQLRYALEHVLDTKGNTEIADPDKVEVLNLRPRSMDHHHIVKGARLRNGNR